MDPLDRLTRRLLDDLEREASDHAVSRSDVHVDECVVCTDRLVQARDDLHAIETAGPASRRLVRKLDELLGHDASADLRTRAIDRIRRVLAVRLPAWAAATAAAVVVVVWFTMQQIPVVSVDWPLDTGRPDRLTPAHRQTARTVSGVVRSIRDATANGVDAHVLSLQDAGGATYVLFAWGRPTVHAGDAVEIEALFTSVSQGGGPAVHHGVVTELRRAR